MKVYVRLSSTHAATIIAMIAMLVVPSMVRAAEIKVLSGMGMKSILTGLTEEFERSTGHKLNITYSTAGLVKDRVANGEAVDVTLMQRYLLDELVQQGKVVSSSVVDISRSPVGLVGRANAVKRDISTVEAFKDTLLRAESLSATDPAAGGLSGSHFAKIIRQLGIADQVKSKTKLGQPSARVLSGEVEYAVLQLSEIIPLKGVQFIGPFPEQLQENTSVSAGIVNGSSRVEAGTALIGFLSSPTAIKVLEANGMVPVPK